MPEARAGAPSTAASSCGQLSELAALTARLGLGEIELGDLVHDVYSGRAAAVNNAGLRAQLAELLGEYGDAAAGVLSDLRPGLP